MRVAGEDALLAGREGLEHERPRADGVLRVEADGEDAQVVVVADDRGHEGRERDVTGDLDRQGVERLHVLHVAGRERRRAAEVPGYDPLVAVDHVLGRERLAVVELDALSELDRPDGGVLVRLDRLGEGVPRRAVEVPDDERVVQAHDPGEVDVVDALLTVHGVGRVTARQGDLQGPAPRDRVGRSRSGRRRGAGRRRPAGGEGAPARTEHDRARAQLQELATRDSVHACELIIDCCVSTHQLPPLIAA